MKFEIHLFMGDKEVSREEMKKYAIRSNTVDRIVNRVVDNAIVNENGEVFFVVPEPVKKKQFSLRAPEKAPFRISD